MSEAATRERVSKQRWAEPGSGHDRIVRWSRIALPSAAGIVIGILALAPLDRGKDVSFILDKKKVDSAEERMRVEEARYTGTDDKGQQFVMTARRAVQPSSEDPVVVIEGLFAELKLPQGPVRIRANRGRYNLDLQKVVVDGPVEVTGPDDYHLQTRDVTIDMKRRSLVSAGPVSGRTSLGPFEAQQIRADLGARTVAFTGGARLKIVQGAVR